jgi:hypothetical protein
VPAKPKAAGCCHNVDETTIQSAHAEPVGSEEGGRGGVVGVQGEGGGSNKRQQRTETGKRIREALEALRAYTRFFAVGGRDGDMQQQMALSDVKGRSESLPVEKRGLKAGS